MNLAGRGTGGRSPVFQGVHLNLMFPDGLAHVPFFPATPAMQKAGCGTVPGFYASGGRGPAYPMVPFGVPWGYPGLSWYTQVMGQCCLTAPTLRRVRVAHHNPPHLVR